MTDPVQSGVEIAAVSLGLLWIVCALAARIAIQLGGTREGLPPPFRQLLARGYDGGWAARPELGRWKHLSVVLQIAWIAVMQGGWTVVMVSAPTGILYPVWPDAVAVFVPAGIESAMVLVLLLRLGIYVRKARRTANHRHRSSAGSVRAGARRR